MLPVDSAGKPCPVWANETTQEQEKEIIKGMDEVHAFISARAKNYLINHGDLKTWHLTFFRKVVPVHYYAGNYRTNDVGRPCLAVDVHVDGNPGVSHREVQLAMQGFSDAFQAACSQVSIFLATNPAARNRNRVLVTLLAQAVTDFIRIHPFINGNGRLSRFLAIYICRRFDLPIPFSDPRNRPDSLAYEAASAEAMIGDYKPLYVFFLQQLSVSSK
jgi:fido (protein-threonine AMPylation protein)